MKKVIFSTMVMLTMVCTAMAQNALMVSNVEMSQGKMADLTVNIQLDEPGTYTAASFNIELPTGFTFGFDVDSQGQEKPDKMLFMKGDCLNGHAVAPNFCDGMARVVVFSVQSKAFKGDSGSLLSLKVKAPANLEAGTTYTGTIKDILLVDDNGAKQKLAPQVFTITSETTGIRSMRDDGAYENGAVYMLDGQLVGKDVDLNKLPKGVYIINGKKRVVK